MLLAAEAGISAPRFFKTELLLDISADGKSTSPGGARFKKQVV